MVVGEHQAVARDERARATPFEPDRGEAQAVEPGVGDPNAGQTEALDAITAVVLGGTSLFGGRGVILGTLMGAIVVGVLRNGLTLMGVSSVYQVLVTGILVILAVTVDQLSRRASR